MEKSSKIEKNLASEENILKQVLEIHGPHKAEKYIQEIFWRTYWKGWLEHRPEVYTDYIIEKNNLYNEFKKQGHDDMAEILRKL